MSRTAKRPFAGRPFAGVTAAGWARALETGEAR